MCELEATVGIEPTIGVLQTPALPLGHVALRMLSPGGDAAADVDDGAEEEI